jgi:hypothetical protein
VAVPLIAGGLFAITLRRNEVETQRGKASQADADKLLDPTVLRIFAPAVNVYVEVVYVGKGAGAAIVTVRLSLSRSSKALVGS